AGPGESKLEMSRGLEGDRLIAACREGETEGFGGLVHRYQERLYPTGFRPTGCAGGGPGGPQGAFLRACQDPGRVHGESSFYTWIYRIAINLALSALRKRRHGAGVGLPLLVEEGRGDDDPAAPLERAERDERIQQALASLAADHRAVVVM